MALGWIDPGMVTGGFAAAVASLTRTEQLAGRVIRLEVSALVSRGRNDLVCAFMDDGDEDWLLMLDSDLQLTPDGLARLADAADAAERPVMAGLYFGARAGEDYPTAVPLAFRRSPLGLYQVLQDLPEDDLVPVDAAGAGCLLVHRSVLQAIRDAAGEHDGPDLCWFRDLPVSGSWYGEDVYFAALVRSHGFPIVVHTGVVLPHRKHFWLDQRHYGKGNR